MATMKVIAVANLKGGSGKTALCHALGVCLARDHGRRVLLVDTDPQASLTVSCGIPDAGGRSLAEVLGDAQPGELTLADVIRPIRGRLDLAPGDVSLADTELYMPGRMGKEYLLAEALDTVAGRYDVALLDSMPTFSSLVINVLTAADGVLIPVPPEYVALRGLQLFLSGVAQVQRRLNKRLAIIGIVPMYYDPRLTHHRAAVEDMRAGGLPVLEQAIGRSIAVATAPTSGHSVVESDPNNKRSAEYRALATEVNAWLETK